MIKFFAQQGDHDCVPSCLYMALKELNAEVPSYDQFVEDMNIDLELGTPLSDLYAVLDSYGFNFSVRWNSRWSDLARALKKGIVFVAFWIPEDHESHCSIVKSVTDKHIFLIDPWYGDGHRVTKKAFMKRWYQEGEEGWILTIEKE